MSDNKKLRFIIVGLGGRGRGSFARALLVFPNRGLPEFKERAELVAFVDINTARAKAANTELGTNIPVYATIDEALAKTQADWAIVTTTDCTHADICETALNHGLNVVVDKPLATSVWECNRIREAAERNNRRVIVGHNARYNENMLVMARLVRDGGIGKVLQVEAGEVLNLDHGGSYFHRWHSEFKKSAGLMTHKCCHQLDLINWIINDTPIGVSAMGQRSFYVPRPDLPPHGPRCSVCQRSSECPHFCNVDAHDKLLRRMYIDVEEHDGYIRDNCVFTDRNTINDQETLNIRYAGGTLASFSLVCCAPREYNYYYFTGTEGRLEYGRNFAPTNETNEAAKGQGLAEMGNFEEIGRPFVRLLRPDGSVENLTVDPTHSAFGHGGADVKLVAAILGVHMENIDEIQKATPEQACNAVAISDMAARSIAGGGRYVTREETGRDFPPAPPQNR